MIIVDIEELEDFRLLDLLIDSAEPVPPPKTNSDCILRHYEFANHISGYGVEL